MDLNLKTVVGDLQNRYFDKWGNVDLGVAKNSKSYVKVNVRLIEIRRFERSRNVKATRGVSISQSNEKLSD